MNPEQLLNQVANAIKNRPVSGANKYWICYIGGDFACIPVEPCTQDSHVVGTYTVKELTEGLSTRQWAKLLTKIAQIQPKVTV